MLALHHDLTRRAETGNTKTDYFRQKRVQSQSGIPAFGAASRLIQSRFGMPSGTGRPYRGPTTSQLERAIVVTRWLGERRCS